MTEITTAHNLAKCGDLISVNGKLFIVKRITSATNFEIKRLYWYQVAWIKLKSLIKKFIVKAFSLTGLHSD
jgi:hypothetical protein